MRLLKADEIRFNYPRGGSSGKKYAVRLGRGKLSSLFFMSHQDIVASDWISQRSTAAIYTESSFPMDIRKKGGGTNLVHKDTEGDSDCVYMTLEKLEFILNSTMSGLLKVWIKRLLFKFLPHVNTLARLCLCECAALSELA